MESTGAELASVIILFHATEVYDDKTKQARHKILELQTVYTSGLPLGIKLAFETDLTIDAI